MQKPETQTTIDKRMVDFLLANGNMTLATSAQGNPYCAHCFYAFDEKRLQLIFKSSPETQHMKEALLNPNVAGAVAPDRLEKHRIRGIQFRGRLVVPEGAQLDIAERIYYRRHPYAKLVRGKLWLVRLDDMKMTDNSLGFGKKLIWVAGPHAHIPQQ